MLTLIDIKRFVFKAEGAAGTLGKRAKKRSSSAHSKAVASKVAADLAIYPEVAANEVLGSPLATNHTM